MFTVNVKRKALRNLGKLPLKQGKPYTRYTSFEDRPIPFKKADVCKLKGYESTCRIRIGNLRIVYTIQWNDKTILIHHIGPREKAYE